MFQNLDRLYSRATGGSNVAADPRHPLESHWPRTSDAPGVETATQWFRKSISGNRQAFLFLVGGPGGGKSHISSQLVSDLAEIDPTTLNLARRAHTYQLEHRKLLLINDATIQETGNDSSSLIAEVGSCLEDGASLIACVNRGILVEELAAASDTGSLESQVLEWVSSSPSHDNSEIETLSSSVYLKHGRIKSPSGVVVEVCVSYVDVCSLFEKAPHSKVSFEPTGEANFVLGDYKLAKSSSRRSLESDEVAGVDLISRSVMSLINDAPEFPESITHNPISANLKNLSDPLLINSLGTIMRGAEITSGQRFTYREVWGAIARAVLGDLTQTTNIGELESTIVSLQPKTKDAKNYFYSLQKLASLRLHQAVFGVGVRETANVAHPINPVTRLMVAIDPIRDGRPGYFDSLDETSGWVTPILDAFSSSLGSGSPLSSVLSQVSGNGNDRFPLAVTEFDQQLDSAFAGVMNESGLKDNERSEIIRWYSSYISRMYAVANGICAFREQIASWITIWSTAPTMPFEHEKLFMSLLRPRRTGSDDDSSYIPLFDSRTISITAPTADAKLSARLSDLKTSTRRDGDSLILTLQEQGVDVADIRLDFALLRDALACTSEHIGVTDVSDNNAPRLERLRAGRLTPSMLSIKSPLSIVAGETVTEVVVAR